MALYCQHWVFQKVILVEAKLSFISKKMQLILCMRERQLIDYRINKDFLFGVLIGKLSSGHKTGKGQFSFQSQKKAMPNNPQTTALISHKADSNENYYFFF